MSDRELLEWAAKAAGVDGKWVDGQSLGWFVASNGRPWEPHLDDGDALRLAIACGLSIEPYPYYSETKHSVIVKQRRRGDQMREMNPTEVVEVYGNDPAAATRLAIVRAAASIGKQKGE